MPRPRGSSNAKLKRRRLKAMHLHAQGMPIAKIAEKVGVKPNTVRYDIRVALDDYHAALAGTVHRQFALSLRRREIVMTRLMPILANQDLPVRDRVSAAGQILAAQGGIDRLLGLERAQEVVLTHQGGVSITVQEMEKMSDAELRRIAGVD